MRTKLLFLRSLLPLQSNTVLRGGGCLHHRQAGSSTRCVSNNIIRPSLPSLFLMPPTTSYERQPAAATKSNTFRHASSSSSSSEIAASFEAPEPPKSHGHPVFPDIQFDNNNKSSSSSGGGDDNRNSDPNAVFVISGASRGIGLQFVKSLLERTTGKIIACCRSPPTISTTASSSNNLYNLAKQYTNRVEILPLDIEDQTSIDTLSTYITKKYQRIDALFNVAGLLGDGGITTPGPERSLSSIDRDWMMKSLGVNLIGPTMLIQALSPLMRTIGKRKIIIDKDDTTVVIPPTNRPPTIIINLSARVGSISDNQLGGWYTYRASKSALNQITRTSSHELKRQGTHIISIHPGTTDTDLSKPFQANVQKSRLFPVEFTVEKLLDVVDCVEDVNSGGFYDWAGKALPF